MQYTDIVTDHFLHPRNMGEIKNADIEAEAGNPVCGDVMRMYLNIKDNKIEDIKFQTFGCAGAISTSSMLTTIAKGKTLEDAKKLTFQQIVKELGGLPPEKMHCSCLAIDTMQKAIKEYEENK